jgi:hypothetical protein
MRKKNNSVRNNGESLVLFCSKEALRNETSGASIRVDTLMSHCLSLGFDVSLQKASVRNLRRAKDDAILVYCSFASTWPLLFKRKNHQTIWIDSTDSVLLTLKFQVKYRKPFRSILSTLRSLITFRLLTKIEFLTYISQRDELADKSLVAKLDSKVFIFPNKIDSWNSAPSSKVKFIFMGSLNYAPNYFGLNSLLRFLDSNGFSHLLREIYVFGNKPDRLSARFPDVHWLGYSSYIPTNLDVHIAPIFAGAGIKNKVAIPVMSGLKVIATNEAATGIIPLPNLLTCKSLADFAQTMTNTMQFTMWDARRAKPKNSIFEIDQIEDLKSALRLLRF